MKRLSAFNEWNTEVGTFVGALALYQAFEPCWVFA